MKKIQTGDTVKVTAWKCKDEIAVVNAVSGDLVTLKGVNIVKRATNKQGYVEKEAPIHVSNVALYDAKAKTTSRVRIEQKDGKKVRVYVKSGAIVKKAV